MQGDAKAIAVAVTEGALLVSEALDGLSSKKLAKLAKGLSALSFALPVASIVIDIFVGS